MSGFRRLDLIGVYRPGTLSFCVPSLQVDGAEPGMICTVYDTPGSTIPPGVYRIVAIGPEQETRMIGEIG